MAAPVDVLPGMSGAKDGSLRFDGRVAVVTGAGNGLGRAYALLLASRGAAVVVNDLGGSVGGEGSSHRAADAVVEEIRAAGGKAVASYDSATDGAAVIGKAVSTWGRVDAVVCNAGILRDASFAKMTEAQWDLVQSVHVGGTFACARAAWPYFRKQNYGRLVCVTSSTGLYGNFGQANYGAAKGAILGLASTLAREGARRGIRVNTIAPIAASRMTEKLLPPDLLAALSPEAVAPVVALLCHERCPVNGAVLEAGGGWVAGLRWERSRGITIADPTPESVRDAWDTVTDFTDPSHPDSTQASFEPIMAAIPADGEGGDPSPAPSHKELTAHLAYSAPTSPTLSTKPDTTRPPPPPPAADRLPPMSPPTHSATTDRLGLTPTVGGTSGDGGDVNIPLALSTPLPPQSIFYRGSDTILYALCMGVADPTDATDLPFLYENAEAPISTPAPPTPSSHFSTSVSSMFGGEEEVPAAPAVLPTFPVLFPHRGMAAIVGHPGLPFDPSMLLHGEQDLVLPRGPTGEAIPLPPSALVQSESALRAVYDKGRAALGVLDTVSRSVPDGRVLCANRSTIVFRGMGGFGGDRGSSLPTPPTDGPAVASLDVTIPRTAALAYRLLGDLNPLHADPGLASALGYEAPILHGLCTLGIAGRAAIRTLADGRPTALLRIQARFVRPVIPGSTLRVTFHRLPDPSSPEGPADFRAPLPAEARRSAVRNPHYYSFLVTDTSSTPRPYAQGRLLLLPPSAPRARL